jgi:hypothetical protein
VAAASLNRRRAASMREQIIAPRWYGSAASEFVPV